MGHHVESMETSQSFFHKFPQKNHSTQAPVTDILEVYLKRQRGSEDGFTWRKRVHQPSSEKKQKSLS